MRRAIRLGMLTPSSNTVLEPVTTAISMSPSCSRNHAS